MPLGPRKRPWALLLGEKVSKFGMVQIRVTLPTKIHWSRFVSATDDVCNCLTFNRIQSHAWDLNPPERVGVGEIVGFSPFSPQLFEPCHKTEKQPPGRPSGRSWPGRTSLGHRTKLKEAACHSALMRTSLVPGTKTRPARKTLLPGRSARYNSRLHN